MARMIEPKNKKEAVLQYMRRNRKYLPGYEIEAAGGLRRMRELRNEGVTILKRKNADGIYEYKLG